MELASTAIREADVGHKVSTAADGLEGSTTRWAAQLVGAHMTAIADNLAENVGHMGVAVRGAGDRYEVTDSDLVSTFAGIC